MTDPATPITNPLTLIMNIKSEESRLALEGILAKLQNEDEGPSPVRAALDKIGSVHFARFVFIGRDRLAVITTYDGSFERYIGAFTRAIGHVFDALLTHMNDAPPLPVREHQDEFLAYVKRYDLGCVGPLYSAYPELTAQQILALQKQAEA